MGVSCLTEKCKSFVRDLSFWPRGSSSHAAAIFNGPRSIESTRGSDQMAMGPTEGQLGFNRFNGSSRPAGSIDYHRDSGVLKFVEFAADPTAGHAGAAPDGESWAGGVYEKLAGKPPYMHML